MNRRRILLALVAYACMAGVAIGLGAWQGPPVPWAHPHPWLDLDAWPAGAPLGLSLAIGALVAVATLVSTRILVERTVWARTLRLQFRTVLEGLSGPQLLALGVASGVAEELLFRGAIQPIAGWVLTSIVFGLVHVGPGRTFLAWTIWAMAMGFVLGAIHEGTGRIEGAMLAHVLVNVLNLRMIALHDARIDAGDGRMKPPRLVPRGRR